MSSELKKRIFTSLVLLSLLIAMYKYSFIMIISLIIMGTITWIEFNALINKIIFTNSFKDKFFRISYKVLILLYLSLLIFFIFTIESTYIHLKIFLLYSVLAAILSDIGGLVFGKT